MKKSMLWLILPTVWRITIITPRKRFLKKLMTSMKGTVMLPSYLSLFIRSVVGRSGIISQLLWSGFNKRQYFVFYRRKNNRATAESAFARLRDLLELKEFNQDADEVNSGLALSLNFAKVQWNTPTTSDILSHKVLKTSCSLLACLSSVSLQFCYCFSTRCMIGCLKNIKPLLKKSLIWATSGVNTNVIKHLKLNWRQAKTNWIKSKRYTSVHHYYGAICSSGIPLYTSSSTVILLLCCNSRPIDLEGDYLWEALTLDLRTSFLIFFF